MFRLRKSMILMAVLTGIATVGLATPARADFQLWANLNGAGPVELAHEAANPPAGILPQLSGSVTTMSGSVIVITASGTGNAIQTPAMSTLDLGIEGSALSGQITSLYVWTTINNIPTLPPPQSLGWTVTTSSNTGGLVESAQIWVSTNNLTSAGINNTIGSTATTPPSSAAFVAGVNTGPLTAPASNSVGFSASSVYSETILYSLTGTQTSIASLSFDTNTQITAAPVPAGLVLALAGMPVLCVGAWFRRRQSLAAAM